jgi:hypothetical protein
MEPLRLTLSVVRCYKVNYRCKPAVGPWRSWERASMASRRSRVRIPSAPPAFARAKRERAAAPEPNGEGGLHNARATARQAKLVTVLHDLGIYPPKPQRLPTFLRRSHKRFARAFKETQRRLGIAHREICAWAVKTYIAFADEKQAFTFERYLKSASGRAFARKRL